MTKAKRRYFRKYKRGVALLIAMTSLVVLSLMLMQFSQEQLTDYQSAAAARDMLVAEYAAKSGINLTRLLIASEPAMRNSLAILRLFFPGGNMPQIPIWDYAPEILGAFNDKEGQSAFQSLGGFDMSTAKNLGGAPNSKFIIVPIPEDGKINLNLGARGNTFSEDQFASEYLGLVGRPEYDSLFAERDANGNFTDRISLCSALMDWADNDLNKYPCDIRSFQNTGNTGAEDPPYLNELRPYQIKNAPYDSLEEAHLVRGMNDNIWATFFDPNPADPSKRIVTVWGSGQINPNSASIQTILAVMCGSQPTAEICTDPQKFAQAASVLGLVQMFTKGMPLFANSDFFISTLQGQTPFGQMIFSITGSKPFTFQSPSDMAKKFNTESKVFSLYVTGVVTMNAANSTRVTIHEVVDFRGAPAIPDSITPSPTAGNALAAAPSSTASSAAYLAPSPAGSAVYYRME